eukprot:TRINITY_DN1517_c0_g1_i2.p1 TRINITY_DN1517_c0_g1~~TRINITY_DN1517_c0_g1_i2.p1  ORF type:complete len:229 (-),score=16.79 TRINITY_DN1517_c0_g1_i2:282-968(-)
MAATGDQGLKLLGTKLSPFVVRVMLSFNLKGIPYDFVEENLMNKSEFLLKSNPIYKKVPVLIHDGKPICESQVILQYVEEAWPSSRHPLLPADPYERALARFWAAFIDDKLGDSLRRTFMNPDKELQKKAVEDVQQNFGHLEEALKTTFGGKAYFGGSKVGYVDVVLGSLYAIIKATENIGNVVFIDDSKTPLLNAWLKRFAETEGVKGLLPDPAIITEFFKKRFHSQ